MRLEPLDDPPRAHVRALVGAGMLVGVGVTAMFVPLGDGVLALAEALRQAGARGVALYVIVYVAATVLLLPGSVLTLVAGFAYGPWWGTVIVFPTATVASLLAFLFGRSLARDWVRRRLGSSARLAAIDAAVAERGLRVTALLRLSPVLPFNLLNYALALTGVRVRDYALASFAMLPGTALYVYLGSLITSASELLAGRPHGGTAERVLYWGGLVATALVTVVLARTARRALATELPP